MANEALDQVELEKLDDARLAHRAGQHPDAFRVLVERHDRSLWGYLANWTDPNTADDLLQDVWVKVFRNLSRFDGQNFRAWVHTIARRLCFDRARGKQPSRVGFGDDFDAEDDSIRQPLDVLIEDEDHARRKADLAR